jgi:4-alpha-glucanotransferase
MSCTQRGAGVLLHISSLPSRQLGADALRFLDVMAQAGLRVWQILPVGPATKHHNPFEPASAFAGDPAWSRWVRATAPMRTASKPSSASMPTGCRTRRCSRHWSTN